MSYLIIQDFKKQIQSDNLQQIIGNDAEVLKTAELQAIEEAYGYLVQKYDTTQEFTDTAIWNLQAVYQATDRVYLDATAYSNTATYSLNALTAHSGKIYKCIEAITVGEAFNPEKWQLIGDQYDLYFAKYPKPLFDYLQTYKTGDQVFWKGKNYTAKRDSPIIDRGSIQYRVQANVPPPSIFPDDPMEGQIYWGTGTPYSVPAGTLPTDTTYWTAGDNRTQSVLMIVIDIALFHLHSRIAPRNVPDLRKDRYLNAIDMLKAFAGGSMTSKLPVLQPKSGARIRFGGNMKNINSY